MLNSLINPKALGEISKDLGQIFFASVFITSLMDSTINYFIIILGLILSIIFWSVYVITRKD
jgi:ABC-type Fe3+-siderophore transport system permease subunit